MWYIFITDWKYSCFLLHVYSVACNICVHNTYLLANTCITIFALWMDFSSFLLLLLSLLDCIMYMFAVLMKCYIRPMFWYYTVLNVLRVIWLLILITFLHYRIYKCGFLLSHMSAFTAVFSCAFKDMYHAHAHTHTLSPSFKKTLWCDSYFVYSVKCMIVSPKTNLKKIM